ncbi:MULTISPECIES: tetratricopeptide repeat protein [unclassified Helicobacter]|uniref:tetratricopeptide repeat protein n=1 Tax=unclassified Helicobacter TaxID=2593540 RepID=UPI000CF1AFD9|nr:MULTISPECIES: tetratricopeptide repeat protein [unclassified Helicobacter]
MSAIIKSAFLLTLSLSILFSSSGSDFIKKAVEAYKNGNFLSAKEFYTKACNAGIMDGCSGLGTLYERGLGVIQNLQKAKEYYQFACNRKNAFGCFHLRLIEEGDLALEYYINSCNDDDALSCLKVGNLYYRGSGIPKDLKSAAIYYQKSCNLRNAQGCFNLGILYRNGEGELEADSEIALAYFYLAKQYLLTECQKGVASSCNLLKSMEYYQLD